MYRWLEPIVEELKELYTGVEMPVCLRDRTIANKMIQSVLILVSCDAPGLRRILGFCGHSGDNFCSKCTRKKAEIPNFASAPANARTRDQHKTAGIAWLQETSYKKRDSEAKRRGYRYNPFDELVYFDSVRFHVIDAMHSLLLGSAKHLLVTMNRQGIMGKTDYMRMQTLIDQVQCPREVGAVPRKIEAKMAHLKADQV
jgi:predicted Fe-S protein YdhL (DUF1289 family)